MFYLLMTENTDGLANSSVQFFHNKANAKEIMDNNVKLRKQSMSDEAVVVESYDKVCISNDGDNGLDYIVWETGEVKAQDSMSTVLTSDAFLKAYGIKYAELYDAYDKTEGYDEMQKKGDAFIASHPAEVVAFARARQDILSSDREVAAFGFTLAAFGL